jgi:Flp pilus assembly pilin Flp
MKIFKRSPLALLRGNRGQTAIEYIFLVAVMSLIIFRILTLLKDNILAKTNPCPAADKSLGCTIQRIGNSFGASDPTFRFFTLRR